MPKAEEMRPPGPRGGLPYFGHMFAVGRDPIGFFGDATRTYGDVVRFDFAGYRYLLINSPDAIKHVLVDNPRNYVKSFTYKGLRFVLGEGLITSEGDFWRRQRKLAQPAFHRERLAGFVRSMGDATSDMLGRWSEHPARTDLDVHREMMRVTLDIVGRTLLSQSLDDRSAGIGEAMAVTVRAAADFASSPFRLPPWVPTPGNVRFNRARKTLDTLVLDIIAARRKSTATKTDLLQMFMEARDEETREAMTDRQLKDEVLTMVTAGHETTANAMSWTLYLLSKHPDVARRVEHEIGTVLGDRVPQIDDLGKLPYTQAVIQESMRIYPPVWGIERTAVEGDVIAGYPVRKGSIVGIFPYLLHRNPAYWENPEGFDPERFLPSHGAGRPRYAYLPFSAGPRICIGNAFAMMEAQVLLSMIVQRYRLELVPGARIEVEPVVTLRPRHGMPMTLVPRAAAAAAPRVPSDEGALEDLLLDRGERGGRSHGVEGGGAKSPVPLGQR